MTVWYVDASAIVKLVLHEPESEDMYEWARAHADELTTSDLSRTEVIRAARRTDATSLPQAHSVLDSFDILPLESRLFRDAAYVDDDALRSLDAIHLAAALALGDDLAGLVTYDPRMGNAAEGYGMTVVVPGRVARTTPGKLNG